MLENKIKSTYLFGFIEKDGPEKKQMVGKELFSEHLRSSTTINSLKIWFGSPAGKNDIRTILGIQIKYLNFITGEKKETEYQGAPIEGMDVEVKVLNIKEGDYLSKMYIGFEEYINHLKFETKKKESIELGFIIEDNEKKSVNELNLDNNIILNIKGYYGSNGVRAIGCEYISYKDFCLIRWVNLFRIRLRLKDEKEKNKYKDDYNNLKDMKAVYRTCILPLTCFASIIKYV